MNGLIDCISSKNTTQNRNKIQASRFSKRAIRESVLQAERYGQFLCISRDLLTKHCDKEWSKASYYEISEMQFCVLDSQRIRDLGDISLCTNLTILLIANNYIARIDALAACTKLTKLDLHSNQICRVPGRTFWSGFHYLYILHLHDNNLGAISDINGLSSCPQLFYLTLYDTPLSIQRYYRHRVVNLIHSLKALDQHVISDEETVQGVNMKNSRFASLTSALRLIPVFNEELEVGRSSYVIEHKNLSDTLRQINRILSHYSPVVIIQRWIRGHMTRCRLRSAQNIYRHLAPAPSRASGRKTRSKSLCTDPSVYCTSFGQYSRSNTADTSSLSDNGQNIEKEQLNVTQATQLKKSLTVDLNKISSRLEQMQKKQSQLVDVRHVKLRNAGQIKLYTLMIHNSAENRASKSSSKSIDFDVEETAKDTNQLYVAGIKENFSSIRSIAEIAEEKRHARNDIRLSEDLFISIREAEKDEVGKWRSTAGKPERSHGNRERSERSSDVSGLVHFHALVRDQQSAVLEEKLKSSKERVRIKKEGRDSAKARIATARKDEIREIMILHSIEKRLNLQALNEQQLSRTNTVSSCIESRRQSSIIPSRRSANIAFALSFRHRLMSGANSRSARAVLSARKPLQASSEAIEQRERIDVQRKVMHSYESMTDNEYPKIKCSPDIQPKSLPTWHKQVIGCASADIRKEILLQGKSTANVSDFGQGSRK